LHAAAEETRPRPTTGDKALKDVDLDRANGQVLALIGPSGAGKSTMIRCINRLVEPTGGKVWLDGHRTDRAVSVRLRGRGARWA
jgi:phosphonate transport system ATP-binding protein